MIKKSVKLLLMIVLALGIAGSAAAQSKKKPADIYIRSAKIEVQSGDIQRYYTGLGYLDTLAMHYGPVSEGLYWTRKIYTDLVDKTGALAERGEFVRLMVAYNDSLHLCCDNKEIDKKFRKDCKKYIQEGDSTMVFYWRTFYNAGVEQVTAIQQVTEDLKNEENEESKKYFENRFAALKDTCEFNMSMAIAIDSSDARPYVGMASVYGYKGEHEAANEWLIRALDHSKDRTSLLGQIGYNFIEQDKSCEAIPYYEELTYAEELPTEQEQLDNLIGSMTNLYVCYTRCSEWAGADKILHRILEVVPGNPDALYRLGRLHMRLGGTASDSASKAEDSTVAERYRDEQNARFDSAAVYLQQAFDVKTDDLEIAENLGLVLYVRGKLEEASVAFARAVELDSTKTDNWLSLGDIYLRLENWAGSAAAYERVIEAQPNNKRILEALDGLYAETKEPDKRAAIKKRLDALE